MKKFKIVTLVVLTSVVVSNTVCFAQNDLQQHNQQQHENNAPSQQQQPHVSVQQQPSTGGSSSQSTSPSKRNADRSNETVLDVSPRVEVKKPENDQQHSNNVQTVKPEESTQVIVPKEEKKIQRREETQKQKQKEEDSLQTTNETVLPEVSTDEIEQFESTTPNDERESKSYLVRGIVSLILVVAGIIALILSIIKGCEKEKEKFDNRGRNYYDKTSKKW
ncbi:MAG: hypothetical protein FWC41_06380 [Firmicutes bacterium]|nr:hypothetical protein [Bacillota bacterium]